jgi:hypothetical protein
MKKSSNFIAGTRFRPHCLFFGTTRRVIEWNDKGGFHWKFNVTLQTPIQNGKILKPTEDRNIPTGILARIHSLSNYLRQSVIHRQ